jgi:hypothetical protein
LGWIERWALREHMLGRHPRQLGTVQDPAEISLPIRMVLEERRSIVVHENCSGEEGKGTEMLSGEWWICGVKRETLSND